MKPIGEVKSLFTYKNGTPRQPSLCQTARGTIAISKEVFNTPEHSLDGIEQYSHIWIIFVFHKNNNEYTKAKVKPPRLNGKRVGLFSTRSPYRPNPIGLTLARLERVEGATLHVSGIDILDGTPVLDIKPYIPSYDMPVHHPSSASLYSDRSEGEEQHGHNQIPDMTDLLPKSSGHDMQGPETETNDQAAEHLPDSTEIGEVDGGGHTFRANFTDNPTDNSVLHTDPCQVDITGKVCERSVSGTGQICDDHEVTSSLKDKTDPGNSKAIGDITTEQIKTADWVCKPPIDQLSVRFTTTAHHQLAKFSKTSEDLDYRLNFLESCSEAESAICQILQEDPRSIYRRQNCEDSLYYFAVDVIHVTCWFDEGLVEVVRIKPVSQVSHLNHPD